MPDPKRQIFSSENLDRYAREIPPPPPRPWEEPAATRPVQPSPFQQAGLAALTDWISTAYGLGTRSMTEMNPTLRFAKNHPVGTTAALAAQDLATIPLIKRLQKSHPRATAGILRALAAYRMGLTLNNLNLVRTNRGKITRK
jgi:hypothetical protein